MKKGKIKYLIMPHLGVCLTSYCSLNCRDCADLFPDKKRVHYSVSDVKADLGKVLEVVDGIEELLLGGGEIFCYPYLNEVLEWLLEQNKKLGKIIIVSNGTITPSKETLDLLQAGHIMMRISGYDEDIVPNRKNVIHVLRENHIAIDDLEGMNWFRVGGSSFRGRSEKELKEVWANCIMNNCMGLNNDGCIYWCSRSTASAELKQYPAPLPHEYVDVRNTPLEELSAKLEAVFDLEYISTCNYCDGIHCGSPFVPVAAQVIPKHTIVSLVFFEHALMQVNDSCDVAHTGREILGQWLKFVDAHMEDFILARELEMEDVLTQTLDMYDKGNDFSLEDLNKVLCLWNRINGNMIKPYWFRLEICTELWDGDWEREQEENSVNLISVCICDRPEEQETKADFIVTIQDIKDEALREKKGGYASFLRRAFWLEKMIG